VAILTVDRANQVWGSDITNIPMACGFRLACRRHGPVCATDLGFATADLGVDRAVFSNAQ